MPRLKLYAWGLNNHGQLGIASDKKEFYLPQEVSLDHLDLSADDIKSVSCGVNNTFIILKNGLVLGAGLNNLQQLGETSFETKTFTPMNHLSEYCIRDISFKLNSFYALTEDKLCIAWGSNYLNKLTRTSKLISSKTPIEIMENVKQVAAGSDHCVILTTAGNIFTFGDGKYGQLGRSYNANEPGPKYVELPEPIKYVASGKKHNLAITDSNRLFGWGTNRYIYVASNKFEDPTTYYELDVKTTITSLQCGWDQSAYLGSNQTFCWDGICRDEDENLKDLNIKQIVFGYEHTLVLLKNGHVLGWGDNQCGSCGIGTNVDVEFPLTTRTGISNSVTKLFSGHRQSFALAIQ